MPTFAFFDLFALFSVAAQSNYIPGVEARGFVFGPPIALAIGAKFVPLRKPRKLPGMLFYVGTRTSLV